MRINSNISGMNAAKSLLEGQRSLQESLAKIASGRRINKAADDASGMVIADSLQSQARGMGQAIRNASDAVSMAQIADGALSESVNIVQTIRDKALQAANDSQSLQSRQAIQGDIDQLLGQLGRIAQTTTYNGQALLSGTFTNKSFQVGANPGETVSLSIDSAAPEQLGTPEGGRLSDIDVTTFEGAQAAIGIADEALAALDSTRSEIGSMQNQLESTIQNLSSTQVNVYASESAIRDTDLAEESMYLSRLKLLNRARAYAQAQANAKNENVLGLFKGDV